VGRLFRVRTEITFSMSAASRAPHRVGAWLVPQAAQYSARWFDRADRTYVTMLVPTSVVEAMIDKVCSLHPSVRCISQGEAMADQAV
jgi:hypothetical protein